MVAQQTTLSVNLNAIALLRNRRNLPWPDMLDLARIALKAGASGITVHPRPDERHIRYADIELLANFLKVEFPAAQFNIEGFPSVEFLELAMPYAQQITLVPDDPHQNTSDHGWDIEQQIAVLVPIIQHIKQKPIKVSVFLDAGATGHNKLAAIGVDSIELYTGSYAACYNNEAAANFAVEALASTAHAAKLAGLAVNAGHDLTVENLPLLLDKVNKISEVSIGHALTADALLYGMERAVGRFLAVLN
ncbi:pyridoxine 5'-phosphate synthase [Bartonella sp. TP]|uniref:pyridoxine 5'-phosphate synthase n=1 Tax=Bartonella sp. TP TaxID=3057550 RepID=UPI0025B026E4|nr:pyridoxine 5'-phosphate synthase [Bartonella sp. TP]MDN5249219.1 pyridoxine 5'-phosphate synthase [Alphaproteobacteria bacterium]WJW79785.1 pyridoxine 5'-phosphate synthase [Bartonella sp. TP]